MTLESLLLPFQLPFMQHAFLIGLIIAVPTALLSCFLVIKGWALMGDAVSHSVLPGIVVAYVVGLPLVVGAFVAGMICAVASGYLAQNSRVKADTIMGVVFSGMFGLGVVMFVALDTGLHLDHILFGNILGVSKSDLWLAGTIALSVSACLIVLRKDFALMSFDPAQAQASGLWVSGLHYGLLSVLSLTIVATLTAVGLILAIALLIAPGAIAYLIHPNLGRMLWLSVLVCLLSVLIGIYTSFWIDSAPAPTIVLVLTGFFLIAFVWRLYQTRRAEKILT